MSAPDFTLKHQREQYREHGKFHTPPELARMLRSLIPGNPSNVYDPTCGAGALLNEFPDSALYGQDIDAEALEYARQRFGSRFHGVLGDVLTEPAFMDRKFDAIVANPPFSIKWDPTRATDERFTVAPTVPTASRADFAFILHTIHLLAPGGTAAVLAFPGMLYRGGREQQLRQWIVEQQYVSAVIRVPGDTFTDTKIETACLVIKKGMGERPVQFCDLEHETSRTVTKAEIAGNDWNLSVTSYVQAPKPDTPPVDPVALEDTAEDQALRRLRAELEFTRAVDMVEGSDRFPQFCHRVRRVVDQVEAGNPALDIKGGRHENR